MVLFAKDPSEDSLGELFEKKYWKMFAVIVMFLGINEVIFEALPQTILGFIFIIYQNKDPEIISIQVSFTLYVYNSRLMILLDRVSDFFHIWCHQGNGNICIHNITDL